MFDYAEENDTKYSQEAFARMFFKLNNKLDKYSHDNFIAIDSKYIEDYDLDSIVFVKFKDVIYRFESIHGQGSYVLFQKNLEQNIPVESYIDFEDFIKGNYHECYEHNKESYLMDNLEYISKEFQKDGISKEDFKSALIKFINKLN